MLHFSVTYLSVPGTFMHSILYYRKVLSCNKPRPGSSANRFASYPGRGSFYTPGVLSIRLFFLFSKQGCQYTEQRESSCGCGGCQWCGIGCFHRFGCLRCCGCFGCRCCGTCCCVVLFGCVGVGWSRGRCRSWGLRFLRIIAFSRIRFLRIFRSSRRLHILPDRHLPPYLRSQFLRFRLPLYSIL